MPRIGWRSLGYCAFCLLVAVPIFLFDLAVPLGVAGGVPYAAVVLIGLWSPWRPMVFALAALGTVLTILGYLLSPEGGVAWVVLSNRALALFVIWATAGLGYVYAIRRTDRALRESEGRFRQLTEGSVQGIVIHRNRKPLFANQELADLFGYGSLDEIYALKDVQVFMPPKERKRVTGYMAARLRGEDVPATYDLECQRKDGSLFWVDTRVRVVDWLGEPAIQATMVDITERKHAEMAVRESEARFRDLFEGSVQGMMISRDFKPLTANQAFADIFGFDSVKSVVDLDSFIELFAPHEHKRIRGYSSRRRKGKEAPVSYECQGLRKDGAPIWLEVRSRRVEWDGVPAVMASFLDITERKQAEVELRTSEAMLASAQRIAKMGSWDWDIKTGLVNRSDEVFRILGLDKKKFEPTAERFLALIHPEDRARVDEAIAKALDGHVPHDIQYRILRPGGEVRMVHELGVVDFDAKGHPLRFSGTVVDVTETLRREREIVEKTTLLEAVLENLSDGITMVDADLNQTVYNRRFMELYDLPPEEFQPGDKLEKFMAYSVARGEFGPGDPEELLQKRLKDLHLFAPHTTERRRPDGTVIEIVRNTLPDGSILSRHTDITERRRAADALRQSEAQFRFVMDAMPALISYVDSDRIYRFVNKTYEDWFEVPREKIIGRSVREIHGEQGYADLKETIDKALSGERTRFEKEIPATPDGARIVQGETIPDVDKDGTVKGYFVLTLDVTENRRATDALRAAKEEAEHANRAKSRFLAAASHDVRQPLHALGLFLGALSHRLRGKENLAIIDDMDRSLTSMEALFDALLGISKLDAGVVEPSLEDFPVNSLLRPMLRLYGPRAEENGLRLVAVGSSAVIRSDPALLNGVLGNLVSNAVMHTLTGRVLVGCRRRGDMLRIEVHDTGPGIPADQLDAIFEEFHQLDNPARDRQQGLGLGLAIVDRTVKLLGHHLDVRSVPGRGTMFAVEVPLGATAKVVPAEAAAPSPTGNAMKGARILVIDDDQDVLTATSRLLGLWGCDVSAAATAEEAMRLAKNGGRPDLIIADYRLPGKLTGEVIIDLVSKGFAQPIAGIVVTGDTSPEVLRKVEASGYKLFHKSLRPARLRALMEHLLAPRG